MPGLTSVGEWTAKDLDKMHAAYSKAMKGRTFEDADLPTETRFAMPRPVQIVPTETALNTAVVPYSKSTGGGHKESRARDLSALALPVWGV